MLVRHGQGARDRRTAAGARHPPDRTRFPADGVSQVGRRPQRALRDPGSTPRGCRHRDGVVVSRARETSRVVSHSNGVESDTTGPVDATVAALPAARPSTRSYRPDTSRMGARVVGEDVLSCSSLSVISVTWPSEGPFSCLGSPARRPIDPDPGRNPNLAPQTKAWARSPRQRGTESEVGSPGNYSDRAHWDIGDCPRLKPCRSGQGHRHEVGRRPSSGRRPEHHHQ